MWTRRRSTDRPSARSKDGRLLGVGVAVFVLGACGRLEFEPLAEPPPGDPPPLPSAVCGVDRIPVTDLPDDADLAIAPTAEGFAALWVATAGGPVAGLRLDGLRQPLQSPTVIAGLEATQLGGVVDVGGQLALSIATPPAVQTFALPYDFASTTPGLASGNAGGSRDPFPGNASGTRRAYLYSVGNQLEMAYIFSDGMLGTSAAFTVGGPITELAGDDGPDHAHAVWVETPGSGISRCTAADINFAVATSPELGSTQVLSEDCHAVRNASGPNAADSMIIVWQTSLGTVEARYIASTGDLPGQITTRGRAPKVRFDGARFWLAWLDERSDADELHIATFDLAGAIVDVPVPGYLPAGDEAFELVRRGPDVFLALLLPDTSELMVLRLCMGTV